MAVEVLAAKYFLPLSTLLFGAGVILLLYLLWNFREPTRCYPPGPAGLPFFGSLLSFIYTKKFQHEVLFDWANKYGPIFSFKLLGTRLYVLNDLALVQEAFNQNPDLNDKPPFPIGRLIYGRENNGILFASGDVWKEQRRLFLTVFKKVDTSAIKFEEIVVSQAEGLISEVVKCRGESFDPCSVITLSIANVIMKIITGVTHEYDNPEFRGLINCATRLFELLGPGGLFACIPILTALPLPAKTELIKMYRELIVYVERDIDKHKKVFDPTVPPQDFISCYLKAMAEEGANNLDDLNLLSSCSDAVGAGWETTASSFVWVVFVLALHHDAQDRMRREILEVVGDGRRSTYSDRHLLPVTEAIIAECMRYRPPLPFNIPHVAACDSKIGGYDIPKGCPIVANIFYLARGPKVWDKPAEFRPDRFLDEDGQFRRHLEPIHFGHGRRLCPGEQLARMEIFLFITYIIQSFELRLPDGAPRSNGGRQGITWKPEPFNIHAIKIE